MAPRRPVPHPHDPGVYFIPLTRGLFATIDTVDLEAVSQRSWHAVVDNRTTYAAASWRENGRKCYAVLHRVIAERMGLDLSRLIDHENRNGLDCRRVNIRESDPAQNSWNRAAQRGTLTGVKGIYVSRDGKFCARVAVRGKRLNLGTFLTLEEAAAALMAARLAHHKEFARN